MFPVETIIVYLSPTSAVPPRLRVSTWATGITPDVEAMEVTMPPVPSVNGMAVALASVPVVVNETAVGVLLAVRAP